MADRTWTLYRIRGEQRWRAHEGHFTVSPIHYERVFVAEESRLREVEAESSQAFEIRNKIAEDLVQERIRAEQLEAEIKKLRALLHNVTDPEPGHWQEALREAREELKSPTQLRPNG